MHTYTTHTIGIEQNANAHAGDIKYTEKQTNNVLVNELKLFGGRFSAPFAAHESAKQEQYKSHVCISAFVHVRTVTTCITAPKLGGDNGDKICSYNSLNQSIQRGHC